ncbi:MAG: ABC transporter permease [Chloroflexi bacterium]|nr:MAG: ABC transporter permease [Chloroflexota bacterium]
MWPITGLTHGRSVADPAVGALRLRGVGQRAGAPVFANPLNVTALVLIGAFAICAVLAPIVAPYDPLAQALGSRLEPPSPQHWLGTDQLGRDIASRLLYGARISLVIGIVVVALAGIFGTLVGLVAGYAGGLVDETLMRVTEVFLAFPPLILAMAIAGALGPSLTNAIIAIAAVTWAVYARLTRGQLLSLRRREFVEAARAIGASRGRILARHLLPNALAPLMVQASFDMGAAIISAAGLSFIGFGAQPPTPEWGVMISEGRNFISTQLWLSLFPGLAILLAVGSFNVLGDGLRDLFDPRLRRAG